MNRIMIQARRMLFVVLMVIPAVVLAADGTGEYLKQEPQYSGSSSLSVFSYVISLLFTFGVVLALAYFTSKFWGSKLSQFTRNENQKVLLTLPLGHNRAVYVVEIVNEYFVLGVTDQNISLLHKITSIEQIEQLKAQMILPSKADNFGLIFRNQLHSLKHMSHKFPVVFGDDGSTDTALNHTKNQSTDSEKR
ncbi:flagellar protein FliO/FliZ [Sporomusaceae bacterium BoRhaA]|uniref:flagellar biosynthetic protein FliO n=1 Tax=Pelorhabdus rhamnosifermentans TaxID=2772457 RepID=UPI001C06111A|nr:flagellar biosynthetic protein FliO [Pelorhabdus rhamnosifermentans]MBU2702000.1 flagellar protein FliO/FliZ [Pelorhabdus rhamnosifermentans]